MIIGDLLAQFDDEAVVSETVLRLGDLRLLADLRKRADAAGMALGAFTALTVQRYADDASDEEWVTLVGQLSRVADPGLALVKRALLYSTT